MDHNRDGWCHWHSGLGRVVEDIPHWLHHVRDCHGGHYWSLCCRIQMSDPTTSRCFAPCSTGWHKVQSGMVATGVEAAGDVSSNSSVFVILQSHAAVEFSYQGLSQQCRFLGTWIREACMGRGLCLQGMIHRQVMGCQWVNVATRTRSQSNSGSPEDAMVDTSNPSPVSTFTMSGQGSPTGAQMKGPVRRVWHMCVNGVVNLIVPSIAFRCPIGLLRRSQRKGVERARKVGVATRESTCEQKNLQRWLLQCVRSLSNSWDRNWKHCVGGLRVTVVQNFCMRIQLHFNIRLKTDQRKEGQFWKRSHS